MKKPRKKRSTKRSTNQQPPPVGQQAKSRPGWSLRGVLVQMFVQSWRLAVAVSVLLTLVVSFCSLYYETIPDIHIAESDPSSPLSAPITVTNKSHFFDMKDVQWVCTAHNVRMAGLTIGTFEVSRGTSHVIEANTAKSFRCSIESDRVLINATLRVGMTYRTIFGRSERSSTVFTWDGRRQKWVEGEIVE